MIEIETTHRIVIEHSQRDELSDLFNHDEDRFYSHLEDLLIEAYNLGKES
jgi:hypothetical protein